MPDVNYRSNLYENYVESHLTPRYDISIEALNKQIPVYQKLLSPFLPSRKEAAILDVGCGHGSLLHFLQTAGYPNSVGVDHSKAQVELARKLGVRGVEEGDLFLYLDKHPASFELITAFDLIEHLKKDEIFVFLKLALRALKPGGKLVVRTPNGASPFSGIYRYGDFTHETAFTRTSIQQLFRTVGFADVKVFPVEPVIHGPASAIRFALWKAISALLRFYLLVETGETEREIFTQNLMAAGYATTSADALSG